MDRRIVSLLIMIMIVAYGCATTQNFYKDSTGAIDAKEVKRILVGTWSGHITKDPRTAIIAYRTPTLQIFRVGKTSGGGWYITLSLNHKGIDAVELTVSETMIRIEFVEHYENLLILHQLDLYDNRRLVGQIWYGTRSYDAAEVAFDKID